jgi:uncharacterized membrane protein
MIKQFRIPLIIFLFGALIVIFGAWAKILHLAFADMALTAGLLLKGTGVILSVYILLKTK